MAPMADRVFVLAAHLWGYAALLLDQGQGLRAAPVAEESLRNFQKSGNATGIGECRGILGRLALWRGDIARAPGRLFQEAAAIATTINSTRDDSGSGRRTWRWLSCIRGTPPQRRSCC